MARWAKGEASIVSASARAAAETTKEVTRSVLRARGEPEDRALDDLLVELTARLVGRDAPAAPPLRTDERFWEMVEELLRWRAASTDEPAPEPGDDGDLEEQGDATGEPFTDAHVADDPEPSPGRAPESKS